MPEVPSIIEFDAARAMRYSPIRKLEIVRIVEKSAYEETVIETELFGRETFVGTYVEVFDQETNNMKYPYDYGRFMDSHTRWEGVENGWYYSDPVDAYQSDIEGELLIEGNSRTQHVNVGDWLLRRRDGRVTRMEDEMFELIYDLDSAHPIPQESE